jgi:hypothetical protein
VLVDASGALAGNAADVTATVTGPLVDATGAPARDVLEDVDVTIEAIINDVLNGSVFF